VITSMALARGCSSEPAVLLTEDDPHTGVKDNSERGDVQTSATIKLFLPRGGQASAQVGAVEAFSFVGDDIQHLRTS
jgi:hypothetical protein